MLTQLLNLSPKHKRWKVLKKLKKEKGSRQGENPTERQWHTRREA